MTTLSRPGRRSGATGATTTATGGFDEGAVCGAAVSVDAGSVWLRGDEAEPWSDAEAACVAAGMHLASIDDSSVQAAVAAALAPVMGDAWVGGADLAAEGAWTWSDGTAWGYAAWRQGQPDDGGADYDTEDCTEVTSTGAWNDRACGVLLPYLCERECTTVWHPDDDGDGLGDGTLGLVDCGPPDGWVANGADCDDLEADLPTLVYADADGDGHTGGDAFVGCVGATAPGDDCDDGDRDVHPGAAEAPGDGVDQDCDGSDAETPGTSSGSTPGATSPADADGDGVLDPAEPPGAGDDAGGAGVGAPPGPPGCGCDSGGRGGATAWLLVGAWIRRRAGARRTCSPRPPCSVR